MASRVTPGREEVRAAPTGRLESDRREVSLFLRRVGDLVRGPAVACRPAATVAEAAQLMSQRGVGSVIVAGDDGSPLGIVTDRDLRAKVLAQGLPPGTPVSEVMSSPLVAIEPDRFAFDALLEMTRRNLHHLGVIEDGRLLGVVSSHDFMLLQGAHPVALVREIEAQDSVEALSVVARQIPKVVGRVAREGVGALDLARLVAEFNDRLVRRAVELGEVALTAEGHGDPPAAYSWLALGSEGRREQTIKTDQDNGLVYEAPPGEGVAVAAAYFGRLGQVVGGSLVQLGFPPCEGGYMASNPRWCQPATVWRQYFGSWMATPHPERLLDAAIMFDLRPVAGDLAPGNALWAWVCERAPSHTLFLRHMAWEAVQRTPPIGLFGRLVVERSGAHAGTLDLKARGVFPMTQAMRVYALSLGLRETNTVDRLLAIGQHGLLAPAQVSELRDAHEVLLRLRLMHQIERVESGAPPDNFIDPRTLSKVDRLLLREAFRTLAWLQAMLADRFQTSTVA